MKTARTVLLLLFTLPAALSAQRLLPDPVYRDSSVATIRIWIHPDSLVLMYRSDSLESDHEYPAEFAFENGVSQDSVSRIGFRLRGNTSRYSKKKSFKVSFNTFESGRSFHGFEKLDLNGEHNDPAIIRSKLCWDLFNGFGVAASRAHHARVFINGRYYGLYISIEHVDENFVRSRFGNNGGNLYKCLWPADLTWRGSSASSYNTFASDGRPVYELQTNKEQFDYSDLAAFITFLNTTSDADFQTAVETRLNVPSFMKYLAVNTAVGSWDDYWFNKNNFYLYHNTATGRFEFIPYDYDNTFGIWWTAIMPGVDWGTRNVLSWGHPSEARPLVKRLLASERFAGWYRYYLGRFFREQFVYDTLAARITLLHTMITPAAETDSFRTLDYGYTIAQFHASYTTATGAHVPYGILPYITTRLTTALQQFTTPDIFPIITQQKFEYAGTDSVTIRATVEDDSASVTVTAAILSGPGSPYSIQLLDDGLHGDGKAGDGEYGGRIPRPPAAGEVGYVIRAQDVTWKVSLDPSNAPATLWHIPGTFVAGPLAINEFMASNSATITDPAGEHDDWIEIINISASTLGLKGKYLTDNLTRPNKWALPDTTLPPGGLALIWADDQGTQGRFHAPYKLDKAGEAIGIFDSTAAGFVVLDSLSFGLQETDISIGRYPDGAGPFVPMNHPTPGAPNMVTAVTDEPRPAPASFALFEAYPNPFNPSTVIGYHLPAATDVQLSVYDIIGREVRVLVSGKQTAGRYEVAFDATGLSSGMYIVRMEAGTFTASKRCILIR
jgi:hypothetical protein